MTKQLQQNVATGEQITCDFLQEMGYSLVETDTVHRLGILEIIAE